MPKIDTLARDIYDLLDRPNADMQFDIDREVDLSKRLISHIRDEVRDPDRTSRPANELYVTQFTSPCNRRVWYNVYGKDLERERIAGKNRFKFVYGDLIEEMVLYFAELAGHNVTHKQHRFETPLGASDPFIICGRIDAIIDGVLIDVKSMEGFSFDRLVAGTYEDKWGYFTQLGIYKHMAEQAGIEVRECAILAVNKSNGRLHVHKVDPEYLVGCWARVVGAVKDPKSLYELPDRHITSKSGNDVLGAGCSYCPFKFDCYERDGLNGLEVYGYSDGPTFMPKPVKRPPKVPQITEAYKKENLGRIS